MGKKVIENMNIAEMKDKISTNRLSIVNMIVQKNNGSLKDTSKISSIRKEIARMLTKINSVNKR